ncbi:hypothetical protein G3578_19640 [Brevibacillus sp. SYP-B805]|uniref:nucleotidyltransferase-like protein n=1 Tax=Brevibacillus sp. SYP-B805 TaxID=1578199 RepID=UPI0013ECDF5A|nr:nucleotidyltransferase-like protein [Brevibacillus sp. SYP-B805]NGQ97355.1 hypothetical protein [Brevibacillus sp. SYP-B805]
MDRTLHLFTQNLLRQDHVLSVLLVGKPHNPSPFLDGGSLLYLVIVNRSEPQWETRHHIVEEERIVEHQISQWQVESWAVHGVSERVAYWLSQAEILVDQHDYMKTVMERLLRVPAHLQKQRVYEEYSGLLRHYLEAKELQQQGYVLDAYQAVLHALHGWARLVVWEAGQQPEPAIWAQVKQIDSAVYKLYEELTASHEPLEKRIELLLLPLEFHVMSKMKDCTLLLTDVMQSRNRPWSVKELQQLPVLASSQINLHLLLEKMAKKAIVHEVPLHKDGGTVHEKGYQLSG